MLRKVDNSIHLIYHNLPHLTTYPHTSPQGYSLILETEMLIYRPGAPFLTVTLQVFEEL